MTEITKDELIPTLRRFMTVGEPISSPNCDGIDIRIRTGYDQTSREAYVILTVKGVDSNTIVSTPFVYLEVAGGSILQKGNAHTPEELNEITLRIGLNIPATSSGRFTAKFNAGGYIKTSSSTYTLCVRQESFSFEI